MLQRVGARTGARYDSGHRTQARIGLPDRVQRAVQRAHLLSERFNIGARRRHGGHALPLNAPCDSHRPHLSPLGDDCSYPYQRHENHGHRHRGRDAQNTPGDRNTVRPLGVMRNEHHGPASHLCDTLGYGVGVSFGNSGAGLVTLHPAASSDRRSTKRRADSSPGAPSARHNSSVLVGMNG